MGLADIAKHIERFERDAARLRGRLGKIDRALDLLRAAKEHNDAGRHGSALRALGQAFQLLGEED